MFNHLLLATYLFLLLMCFPILSYADTTTGLVGWWKFDETSGNALDSSGLGNTGTLTNSPTRTVNCFRNGCLSFAAASSHLVNISNIATYQSIAFSVSLWFKLNTTFNSSSTTSQPLISKFSSDNCIGFQDPCGNLIVALRGSDYSGGNGSTGTLQVKLELYDGSGGASAARYFYASSPTTWTAGIWYHVVIVSDVSYTNEMIYVNAQDVTVRGVVGTTVVQNTNSAYFGIGEGKFDSSNLASTKYFDGLIDDVRLYNRTLSAQDVYMLYLSDNKIRGAQLNGVQMKN